jgi:hypothetical protein
VFAKALDVDALGKRRQYVGHLVSSSLAELPSPRLRCCHDQPVPGVVGQYREHGAQPQPWIVARMDVDGVQVSAGDQEHPSAGDQRIGLAFVLEVRGGR